MLRKSYTLNAAIIVSAVGAGIFCLDLGALGRRFRLHTERPDASLNLRAHRADNGVEWRAARADLPSGAAHVIAPVESASPLIRVDISGPLDQRAGFAGECGGWSDGHDAVADRLCAAFAEGDVLLVIDGPGGAAAGIGQNVERALKAKAAYGRRCTVYCDECIASAHYWWASCLADEIFTPPSGQLGSIGARGEHTSIAGMLAHEGIVKTYFADPVEKVALAPEFPLSPVGEQRGNRDVTIAADMFRAAVCASPIGQANGLTPEYLIELGADMLTGENAVKAGLATGVESFDTVVDYALSLAESEPGSDARASAKTTGASRAGRTGMSVRAEEKKEPEKTPESERGAEPTGKCKSCGMQNEEDSKFCDQCGKSMAAERTEEKTEEPSPDSRPPPSSKPHPKTMTAPAKQSASATTASILRASADSPLAIKTAAIEARWVMDTAFGVTGETDAAKVVGALLAVPAKIDRGARASADLAAHLASADKAERWGLLMRAEKAGINRSDMFADVVDDDGKRVMVDGKPKVRIRSAYGPDQMPLPTLRTMVKGLEKSAPVNKGPWQPDEKKSKGASDASKPKAGEPSDALIEKAMQHPTVIAASKRSGNTLSIKQLATTHAKLFMMGGNS